uniref:acyl-CoA synthetase family member 3, mitochondrial isoform X2 n=1 Tax=Ciona intestinalis TaxID=7719 RepID=UPI00089DC01F|nr:acyl-CoA synthetase family member 3, mitochondrial isoform X2 [Ciona intestinalis]|eukprot:XP_018673154.1 acyl-CoA synthetase family member 3, mitochondrial isoform X2 [Ciona intestinalis]
MLRFVAIIQNSMRCISPLHSKHRFLHLSPIKRKISIHDQHGNWSWENITTRSTFLKSELLKSEASKNTKNLNGERVCFLTPNDSSFVSCLLAVWSCGGIAVPLCSKHPPSELEYVINHSRASTVVSAVKYTTMIGPLCEKLKVEHVQLDHWDKLDGDAKPCVENFPLLHVDQGHNHSLIMYTSGTTGPPKGVLFNHSNIRYQIKSLVDIWEMSSSDVLLHVLPLHHIHGFINALLCPLSINAAVVMEPSFEAGRVWKHLLGESCSNFPRVNVFMAVPTIYTKLIQYFDEHQMCVEETKKKCKDIRLMVSGSASLPLSIMQKWKSITGHTLLERYGMTEFGMGLTNPYKGKRIPGYVGLPFPNVEAKIAASQENGEPDYSRYNVLYKDNRVFETEGTSDESGELLIKSKSIFQKYWNNNKATKESFVDGWFKTGDIAVFEDGMFRIVGRSSVDIIKSGGFKLSALDVERVLLEHDHVEEASVLGVPDDTWGQKVVAVIKLTQNSTVDDVTMTSWCREHMARYRIPREFKFVKEIPRNAMGKVNKKTLLQSIESKS